MTPKENPYLFLFGHLVDLDTQLQDLTLVLKKSEEIEFKEHPEITDEIENEVLTADIFPNIIRYSFIVSLIIIFEEHIKTLCNLLKEIEEIPLKLSELKGSALDRFIIFTEKLSGLKIFDNNEDKEKIKGLIEIRNCIIHNSSSIESYNKSKVIKNFCNSIDGITINENDVIELTYDACLKCSGIVLNFFNKAYSTALNKYPPNE